MAAHLPILKNEEPKIWEYTENLLSKQEVNTWYESTTTWDKTKFGRDLRLDFWSKEEYQMMKLSEDYCYTECCNQKAYGIIAIDFDDLEHIESITNDAEVYSLEIHFTEDFKPLTVFSVG